MVFMGTLAYGWGSFLFEKCVVLPTVVDERCLEKMENGVIDMVLENSKMNHIKKIKIRFNKRQGFFEDFLKKI